MHIPRYHSRGICYNRKMYNLIQNIFYKFKHSRGFRSTIVIAIMGIASQLLGMERDILMANQIGVGEALDIYYAAFKIPDFIYSILISIVAGVTIIPLLSKAVHEKNWKEVSHKYSALFNFFVLVTLIICVIVFIFMPGIISFIFPHTSIVWQSKVSDLSRIMLIQPILLNISNIFATLAMAENKFMTYAIAPLFYNLGIIIGIVGFYDSYGERGLIWGVILGAVLNLAVQSISFWTCHVRLSFNVWDWSVVKEELKLAAPRSMSLIMLQGRALFVASMTTLLGTGVLTAYTFANNFYMIPITAIGVSFITVAFPKLSALYESQKREEFYHKIQNDIVILICIAVPAAIAFYFLSSKIVNLVYPHLNDKASVIIMLSTLSCTIPLYVLTLYYTRASFARRDAITPLISQSLSVVSVVIAIYLLYIHGYGILSIVYAFNISLILEFLIIYFLFHHKSRIYEN